MSKYGARKTVVDGITFASAKEARRYGELRLLERAGQISKLELQPKYPMVINGWKICTYFGDFRYRVKTGETITEDTKGVRTREFEIKRKLMRAVHGIEVLVT